MTSIQPKNDRILVKMLPSERSSVIETAKDTKSTLLKGEILAVGPKVKAEVSVGEFVLFTQACKDSFGDSLMLIRDNDLVSTIPNDSRVTDGRSYVS